MTWRRHKVARGLRRGCVRELPRECLGNRRLLWRPGRRRGGRCRRGILDRCRRFRPAPCRLSRRPEARNQRRGAPEHPPPTTARSESSDVMKHTCNFHCTHARNCVHLPGSFGGPVHHRVSGQSTAHAKSHHKMALTFLRPTTWKRRRTLFACSRRPFLLRAAWQRRWALLARRRWALLRAAAWQ